MLGSRKGCAADDILVDTRRFTLVGIQSNFSHLPPLLSLSFSLRRPRKSTTFIQPKVNFVEHGDDKRAITYDIQKNKGLTGTINKTQKLWQK